MLTGVQIRCARAALRWTAQQLAERAGVGVQTIKRFEQSDGIPPGRTATLIGIQAALEAAGIELIGAPSDRPGIRVRLAGQADAAKALPSSN